MTTTKRQSSRSGERASPASARERAISAYDEARDRVRGAGRSASDQLGDAPLLTLGGGLALGALIATLLPVGRRERDLVAPLAGRVKDSASAAASAAREAGEARLDELGLTRDKGSEALRSIVDGAADALRTSAKAAAEAVRGER
jgi:hypothetical protein